jgi:hypothetical protein
MVAAAGCSRSCGGVPRRCSRAVLAGACAARAPGPADAGVAAAVVSLEVTDAGVLEHSVLPVVVLAACVMERRRQSCYLWCSGASLAMVTHMHCITCDHSPRATFSQPRAGVGMQVASCFVLTWLLTGLLK